MNIFIWAHLDEASKLFLRESLIGHEFSFVNRDDTEQAKAKLAQADIVFGNIPPQWLETPLPNLRWIQLESVGFGGYHGKEGVAPITVTNLRGFFAEPVAETALAGILALYRKLDVLIKTQAVSDRNWKMLQLRGEMALLEGQHVVILGGGSIGLRVKKLLGGFDCNVVVFSKSTPEADIYSLEQLDAALTETDVVVACLPHSEDTVGIMSAQRLSLMPQHAIFVNVGRGSAVDELALIDALQNHRLGGAVLDVTYEEPLPKDHPLWDAPNTIITQHTGGGFSQELLGKTKLFIQNLERYKSGEQLENVVNFDRGY